MRAAGPPIMVPTAGEVAEPICSEPVRVLGQAIVAFFFKTYMAAEDI